jgi:hypothetical protein
VVTVNWQELLYEKRHLQWIREQKQKARKFANEFLRIKEDEMIQDCHVYFTKKEPDFAVICIPGRGNDGAMFANEYHQDNPKLKRSIYWPNSSRICMVSNAL